MENSSSKWPNLLGARHVRVPGDLFPDIVAEGKRLIAASDIIVTDMDANIETSPFSVGRSQLEAIFPQLSSAQQEEYRSAIAQSPAQSLFDKICGAEASFV